MKRSFAVAAAVFAAALVVVFGAWHFGYFDHHRKGAPSDGASQSAYTSPAVDLLSNLFGLKRSPAQSPQEMAQAPTFAFRRLEIDTSKPQPEACLVFTRTLDATGKTHYEDYFTVDPKMATAIRVADTRLCLTGLQFNQTYSVALKAGLPAANGEKLGQGETIPVELRDKPALVRFTGGIILPRDNRDGVPVMTVNVKKLSLKIVRVGDRLLSQLESGVLDQTALYHWDEQQLENNQGTLVWSGSVEVASLQNASVTTLIPINDVLKGKPPGAYVLIASDANKEKKGNNDYDYSPVAAQWVIDSDIAVTTFQGADGLSVFARSYATAKPLDGVKLTLVARNNNLLSSAQTDRTGRADFGAGFFRGKGGDEPVVVMAYGSGGDFSFLDLRRPAFDLTDRGVGGRATPGPVDAFLYTERGVYRPGETVQATAMLRDRVGKAVKAPLTLIATRPDGMEVGRKVVAGDNLAAGSAAWSLDLNATAPHGRWQIAAYIDPKADPVGRVQFDVADFVPQRLKVALTPEQPILHPKTDFKVRAEARFLYGAPAAGLSGDGEARITRDPKPFPDFKAYTFGRVEDSFDDVLVTLTVPETDASGVTQASGSIGELAATTLPLKAVVKVSIHEPGGRTTDKTVELPVRTSDVLIGMRPDFDGGSVGENARAGFEMVALDATGKRIARDGLTYSWLKEDTNYEWYQDNNEWKYQAITRDRQIAGGTFSISADATAKLFQSMSWGSYRLVVTDPKSGASSSYRFYSGWSANASGDRPDRIPVATDKPSYAAGQTAHISIKPNADGRALVVIAGDRVFSSQLIRAPKSGASIDIPVSADWGAGAYVLVTHYRALNDATGREPVRSIGVAWLGVDNGPRTLAVNLGGPKKVLPRQRLNLPVSIKGVEGETAYLTLAAVDEGILQLTEFQSPDPVSYYFGKRRLGVGMRDDYGRLIKAEKGAIGSLREGGDSFGGRPLAVVPTRTVALFSGLVKVDANGNANVPIEIPDFNGELRLMAVAFTDEKLGHADRPLTVRDPVVADLVLPRFLAPGDHVQAGLNLDNVEGKPGSYTITVKATGPVGVEGNAQSFAATRDLKTGQRVLVPVALQGNGVGIANVSLTLNGPGLKLTHSWPIEVRSPQLDVVNESIAALPAGKSYVANKTLIANVVPSTANIALTVSANAPGYSNVAGQLRWLSKYPYGCIEQTTSGAMPLLYFNDVAKQAGLPADKELRDTVQNAVDRVLDMQNYGGDFGMWGPGSNADTWVSVFALDFVSQAKAKGYVVPDEALRRGTGWLREIASSDSYSDSARAYAFYVLAHLGQLNLSDLRYFSDTRGPEMKMAIAAALSGAAAASAGDRSRATVQFNRARNLLLQAKDSEYTHAEYGSLTRDLAGTTALAMESGEDGLIPALVEKSNNLDMSLKNTTTQEKAWILRASYELSKHPMPLKIAINGKPAAEKAGAVRLAPSPSELSNGITFLNNGDARAWRISSVQGSPSIALPAETRGLSIKKTIWTMSGQPADLTKLKQNDRVIIEISGSMDNNYERQMGVIDMLPAGFEIEMPLTGDDTKPYPFLGSLSNTTMRDARDDRFVAAFNIGWPVEAWYQHKVDSPDFRVAYIARATTPGRFVLPAAVAEDMYAPAVRARTAAGKVSIAQ